MDKLPVEVIQLILDCLTKDPHISTLSTLPVLRLIALTCSSLFQVVQPYLYRTVYLAARDSPSLWLEQYKDKEVLTRYTRNVFLDTASKESAVQVLPMMVNLFPLAQEVAWSQLNPDTFLIGHHLSRSRSTDAKGLGPFKRYNAFVSTLLPSCFDLLSDLHMSQLTHMTITVPRVSINRSDTASHIEETLRIILQKCPLLQSLVISIGYNATGLGSRSERMLRSSDIREAIRRVKDDRISSEVADHMFGQMGRHVWDDIITCMKASWLSRVDA